jgi:hypothetical protein
MLQISVVVLDKVATAMLLSLSAGLDNAVLQCRVVVSGAHLATSIGLIRLLFAAKN